MHFVHRQTCQSPTLKLNEAEMEFCDTVKFLGLIWDRNLTWDAHVAAVREKGNRVLALLRLIAGTDWRADQ